MFAWKDGETTKQIQMTKFDHKGVLRFANVILVYKFLVILNNSRLVLSNQDTVLHSIVLLNLFAVPFWIE